MIKAHEGEPAMAGELKAGRAIGLYAHRDIRDVVFSLMHKRGMTFEQILRQGMIHQILANDRFWMARPNVLVQRYDNLINEPARGVTELANHLGFPLKKDAAERIAALYSQESNRAELRTQKRLEQAGVDLENAGNTQICDPASLLHWNHMRQKGAGSWHTTATPQQVAILRRLSWRWLKRRGYSLEGMTSSPWNIKPNGLHIRSPRGRYHGRTGQLPAANGVAQVSENGANRRTPCSGCRSMPSPAQPSGPIRCQPGRRRMLRAKQPDEPPKGTE